MIVSKSSHGHNVQDGRSLFVGHNKLLHIKHNVKAIIHAKGEFFFRLENSPVVSTAMLSRLTCDLFSLPSRVDVRQLLLRSLSRRRLRLPDLALSINEYAHIIIAVPSNNPVSFMALHR